MPTNHIVKSYDEDLTRLKETLLSIAHFVQEQFQEALLSLEKHHKALAYKLIGREKIDQLEISIDRISLNILNLRQLVTFDFCLVIATLKKANHLECMADYATNIARRVLVFEEKTSFCALSREKF